MKKQWMTGIIISVILLTGAGAIVYAQDPIYRDPTMGIIQEKNTNKTCTTDVITPLSNDTSKVKFRGIWGYEGFNETSGYLGGVLVKRGHVIVLKGLWNTTDNIKKGNIVGILKKGYFNGRIITQNQTIYRIIGLYRYDAEKSLLHIHWITAQQTGWAHCRILINE